jgi:hypothetical protein
MHWGLHTVCARRKQETQIKTNFCGMKDVASQICFQWASRKPLEAVGGASQRADKVSGWMGAMIARECAL